MVIFTADNGTHKSITSKLPELYVKGGKGSMTEAGTRVPFLAYKGGQFYVRNKRFRLNAGGKNEREFKFYDVPVKYSLLLSALEGRGVGLDTRQLTCILAEITTSDGGIRKVALAVL